MLTWTMAHPWMTFFLGVLIIVGLVVIVVCISTTVEEIVMIKNPPSPLDRILAKAEGKQ